MAWYKLTVSSLEPVLKRALKVAMPKDGSSPAYVLGVYFCRTSQTHPVRIASARTATTMVTADEGPFKLITGLLDTNI